MTDCIHSITLTVPDRVSVLSAGAQGPPGRDGLGEAIVRKVTSSGPLLQKDSVLVDATGRVDLELPDGGATEAIRVACVSGGFRVTQKPGQQVRFNDDSTSLGAGGYIELLDSVGALVLQGTGSGRWLVTSCTGSFEVS